MKVSRAAEGEKRYLEGKQAIHRSTTAGTIGCFQNLRNRSRLVCWVAEYSRLDVLRKLEDTWLVSSVDSEGMAATCLHIG